MVIKHLSARVDYPTHSLYVSSRPRAEDVPTNIQRGRGSGLWIRLESLGKSRHIVPNVLLVVGQRSRKDQYKTVEGTSARLILLSVIIRLYFRRRRRFTIF